MNDLVSYARELVAAAGQSFQSGEVLAKVLTTNDDSGRHGVLIPSDAYPFFPDFQIPDPAQNATMTFPAFDALEKSPLVVAYKYYERYPERRITRLNGLINDRTKERRLVVVLRARHMDGTGGYYIDCAQSGAEGRFDALFLMIFGSELAPVPGAFVARPVESGVFSADADLSALLDNFDAIKAKGWVDSLREGDTGIGYTFETLAGIKENNDKRADFRGIEIKCKALKEGTAFSSGKINLFQQGPTWADNLSAKARIQNMGKRRADGSYACHSQVTTVANNLGLMLVLSQPGRINLRKRATEIGYWSFIALEKRLKEKHSRAAIIKARTRKAGSTTRFSYEELIYCERPSMDRFVTLVRNRNIVFEFLMSLAADGEFRNRGYPWRLVREEFLDQLFSFQARLR